MLKAKPDRRRGHDPPEPKPSPPAEAAGAEATDAPAAQHEEHELRLSLDEDFTFTIATTRTPRSSSGVPRYRSGEGRVRDHEEDLDRELKALQEQNALVVEKKDGTVERATSSVFSYAELDEQGEEKRGTKREGFSFEVGTGYNLYALDDDVVGLAVGDEKIVEKTFPADYQHKELAERTVKVKVKVSSIREKNLPASTTISRRTSTTSSTPSKTSRRTSAAARGDREGRGARPHGRRLMDALYQGSRVPGRAR